MSVLYVVRHGQASFYSQNYDQLSETGYEQSRMLGEFWRKNEIEIDAVYAGSLKRQVQTAESCGESYGNAWPETRTLEGLNEYHADDVMKKLKPELIAEHPIIKRLDDAFSAATETLDRYRSFHRLLEAVMERYIAGGYKSAGFETWPEFHHRVSDAFQTIRANEGRGRSIAVFTSGGPIGVSVQTCLQSPQQSAAQLNWRVLNASITQYTFSNGRNSLDQFNAVPHLSKEMLTYR